MEQHQNIFMVIGKADLPSIAVPESKVLLRKLKPALKWGYESQPPLTPL
jgi:hypothetical protein